MQIICCSLQNCLNPCSMLTLVYKIIKALIDSTLLIKVKDLIYYRYTCKVILVTFYHYCFNLKQKISLINMTFIIINLVLNVLTY